MTAADIASLSHTDGLAASAIVAHTTSKEEALRVVHEGIALAIDMSTSGPTMRKALALELIQSLRELEICLHYV